jgi:anti-sigma B factor antagonist
MELNLENLNDSTKVIVLTGRMDFTGTQEIDMKFTGHTASSNQHVLVDMSGVEFVASIGIRTLVTNAKALKLKDRKMILFGLQDNVAKVLDTAGITAIIPACGTREEALQKLEG